jgi:hypothetical protein
VLIHWSSISGIIPLCQQYLAGEHLSKAELNMVYLKTDEYRKRLMCISDFMQLLNQHIARQGKPILRIKLLAISGKHASRVKHFWMSGHC